MMMLYKATPIFLRMCAEKLTDAGGCSEQGNSLVAIMDDWGDLTV
jgi:hypothetical protein